MNLLSHEKSPYLLQHADNPVHWLAWNDETFAKARAADKPVLLSIGYSTCHWCHVMAHESFEDPAVAEVMNTYFTCIKVDREERPDVDHIYMGAVMALTGQGGWPLTVFLTPDAKPFYGGTYFPPHAKWGSPGFVDLLHSVAASWKNDRQGILDSSQEMTKLLRARSEGETQKHSAADSDALSPAIITTAARHMSGQYDRAHGGFGTSPKFPMGHMLTFLLRQYQRDTDTHSLNIVEHTLKVMAEGGIYDQLGGGFHRYSTDQQWHVPHFEKMLYDQSLLVPAYVQAYQATGKLFYARIAAETCDYVLRDLTSPEGGLYCAEDADSDGKEGSFYVWSHTELLSILGERATALLERTYGVLPDGNVQHDPHGEFTRQNILYRAAYLSDEEEAIVEEASAKLFARRNTRNRPHLDDKILTDWNGLMIAALAFAGAALGKRVYIDAAIKAANFILKENIQGNGRLMHRWREGEAAIDGMLDDYAFLSYGLIQLYEATLYAPYLAKAIELADAMIERFIDPARGGFFMTAIDTDAALILRPQDIYDGAIPSGNAGAAWVLVKLYYLTLQKKYHDEAERMFARFSPTLRQSPSAYAFMLGAYDAHTRTPLEVTVRGNLDEAFIANVRKLVYKHFIPQLIVRHEQHEGARSFAVCRGTVCLPPVEGLDDLEQLIVDNVQA